MKTAQKKKTLMTTTEFQKETGMPVALIRKWLREGKIKGYKNKRSGKWQIPRSQLNLSYIKNIQKKINQTRTHK